jgi:competence protein ComEC
VPVQSWILLSAVVGAAAGGVTAPLAACALCGVCLAIGVHVRRHGRVVVAAVLLLAGATAARAVAERWRQAACRHRVIRAESVRIVPEMHFAAGTGGPVVLEPLGHDRCALRAWVQSAVPLRGGTWHHARIREPRLDGLLAVRVTAATPLAERSPRAALRAAGIARVDTIFGQDAPMARALLLADMHLIDRAVRDRWSRAGLVHMLSVSGMHVAIVASSLLLLARAVRLRDTHASALALLVTGAYIVILGLPPPAMRAAVMFAATRVASLRQRPAAVWSVLTLGAVLPVAVDPLVPLDLGWQLSVLGVVSLACSSALGRTLRWSGDRWWQSLRRDVLASVIASVASAPLVAWHFGTMSVIAPLANLLAAPLIGVLQPALFLALLLAPVTALARFAAGAAAPLLGALDGIASAASALPWAALSVTPTLWQAAVAGVLVSALLAACVRPRVAAPLMVAGTAGLVLILPTDGVHRASGLLEVHMLDVGQGDAFAIRTPQGRWVIIDAGGGAPGVDQGRRVLIPYVRTRGGDVAAFMLSHPHLDHVGGAPAVISRLQPGHYFDAAFAGSTNAYRASLDSAARHDVAWARVRPGAVWSIDGVRFRFLAPDSAWTASLDDANLASTVVRVEFGEVTALFMGDAEREEEQWLLSQTAPEFLQADILKVGHHGSRTSSSAEFLDAVRPRVAMISVGRGNQYGHPAPEVLTALADRGAAILRTDIEGTTVLRTDGRQITVATAARTWTVPSR